MLSKFGKKVENGGTGDVEVGCVDCGGGDGMVVFVEGWVGVGENCCGCEVAGCFSGVAKFSIALDIGIGDCRILFSRCSTRFVCFTVLSISGSNTNGDDFPEFRV